LDEISWATDPQGRAIQTPPRVLIPAGGNVTKMRRSGEEVIVGADDLEALSSKEACPE
jgi:hypothetical protein